MLISAFNAAKSMVSLKFHYFDILANSVCIVCMYWNRELDSISPSRHFGLLGDAVPVLVSAHLDLLSSIKRR